MLRAVICADEPIRTRIEAALQDGGCPVSLRGAAEATELEALLDSEDCHLLVVEYRLAPARELAKQARRRCPSLPIVLLVDEERTAAAIGAGPLEILRIDRIDRMPVVVTRMQERIARVDRLTSDNARLVEELVAASQGKSEFIGTVSHELRTPLSAILGYADLLLEGDYGPLNVEQEEVLRRAEKNASDLLDLINATLDLSRIEVSDLPLQVEEVSFAELATAVLEDVRGARQRLETRLSWRDGEATVLESDTGKLKIVLKQILGAAIDATLSGQVEMRGAPEADRIVIEIGDLERLDTGPETTEAPGDSGADRGELALNVARRLLEILGGDLAVHANEAGGTLFRVRLPRSIRG